MNILSEILGYAFSACAENVKTSAKVYSFAQVVNTFYTSSTSLGAKLDELDNQCWGVEYSPSKFFCWCAGKKSDLVWP